MTQCPDCGVDCSEDQESCPSCGATLVGDNRKKEDQEILAKDHWTQNNPKSVNVAPERKNTASPIDKTEQLTYLGDSRPNIGERKIPRTTPRKIVGGATLMGHSPVETSKETAPIPLVNREVSISPTPPETNDDGGIQEKSDIVKTNVKQVALDETPLFVKATKEPGSRAHGQVPILGADLQGAKTRVRLDSELNLSLWLGISSIILILTWFIPSIWGETVVLPAHLIKSAHGIDLVALLVQPTCGALLLALLIAQLRFSIQAGASLVLGLVALVVPLLIGNPALPLDGIVILVVTAVMLVAGVLFLSFVRIKAIGHVTLILVPGALLATAVFGVISGRIAFGNLEIFKGPFTLWAAMLVLAVSTTALIRSYGVGAEDRRSGTDRN